MKQGTALTVLLRLRSSGLLKLLTSGHEKAGPYEKFCIWKSKREFIVYLLLHPSLSVRKLPTHIYPRTYTASSSMSIDGGPHNPISCASCAKPSEVWHTERVHGDYGSPKPRLQEWERKLYSLKKSFRSLSSLSVSTIAHISHTHWGIIII